MKQSDGSVTLKNVADAAGVGLGTASRALSGAPNVSSKTRNHVAKVAEELGYVVNRSAQNLVSKRWLGPRSSDQQILAMIYPKATRMADPQPECRAAAMAHGYEMELFGFDHEKELPRIRQILESRGIRGVLYFADGTMPEEMNHLWDDMALVTLGNNQANPKAHSVFCDYYFGLRIAIENLCKLGYKRIGVRLVYHAGWLADGYTLGAALLEKNVRPEIASISTWPDTIYSTQFVERGAKPASEWIEEHDLDAVIWPHDKIVHALEEDGWKIPEDLGVVALGGAEGRISGISPWKIMPGIAVDLLVSELRKYHHGLPDQPSRIAVAPEWHPGETTRQQV